MQNVCVEFALIQSKWFRPDARFFYEHLSCPFNLLFVLNLGYQTTFNLDTANKK